MTKSSSLHELHGEIPRSPPAIACIAQWPSARLPGLSPKGTEDFAIEASSETMLGSRSASLRSISDDCSRSGSASRRAGGSLRCSRSSGLTRRERHLWRQAPSSVTGFHPLRAGASVRSCPEDPREPYVAGCSVRKGFASKMIPACHLGPRGRAGARGRGRGVRTPRRPSRPPLLRDRATRSSRLPREPGRYPQTRPARRSAARGGARGQAAAAALWGGPGPGRR